MTSSDDEGEVMPHAVSNYHFVDNKDEPISFSELPIQWNAGEGLVCEGKQIFLHGTTDDGLQKIYKQVMAWKFDLSNVEPEISVLSKESNWIKLQKPRKSFEGTIRTILITVHCLHFVRKNPETSGRSVWVNLSKVFSSYEARASKNDLIDHTTFISEAVKRDGTLASSKFLVTFLEEKPLKKEALDEDNGMTKQAGFIVDDNTIDEKEEDDGSDEEIDLFDSVCAICDNGGKLLCCDGRCMRSFHATKKAGSESKCDSLRFSDEEEKALEMQDWFCKNCQYKQHQCFSCGELGSSDKLSGAEVFPCVSATCGHFYHPRCAAKLLHRESAAEAEELQKKIADGESFTCPIHKCIVCKQGEDKTDPDLQFAVCRRCPKSYHRKCLPSKIAFEDSEDEDSIRRAWEDLIPDRILIYCLKHVIDDDIGTPIRNHIKFPDDGQKMKKQASQQFSSEQKILKRERILGSEDAPGERAVGKAQKGVDMSLTIKKGDSSKNRLRRLNEPDFSKKQKVAETSTKPLNAAPKKVIKSTAKDNRPSSGGRLSALNNKGPKTVHSRNEDKPYIEHKRTPELDDEAKQRILALVKESTCSITLEDIIKTRKFPTTYGVSSKHRADKAIPLGRVEGSVEALRAALQKLEEGCGIEDAKAVCEPGLLHQMVRWKNKLKVYLAPFLHGVRYTSFGRHFTKVDKLKEIVDRLQCYVQDGDMIVDFCCGANDFSCLMKKKLDETGKKCSYKNFDVLQAKSDFNFEKRDWMSVQPKELPNGSQLIMGLNPPFGLHSALANKFIDKALQFKPKLLILIVPGETERLDKKSTPYDLVWEDEVLLAGKSFYLPGSVDLNANELEDWNNDPPPLYLWSRSDWTAQHREIAKQHGHLSRIKEQPHLDDDHGKPLVSDCLKEDCDLNVQTSVPLDEYPVQSELHGQLQERRASVPESQKEGFPTDNKVSKKKGRNRRKRGRGLGEATKEGKVNGPSPSRHPGASSHKEVSREGDRHFDQGVTESPSHFRTGYGPSYADNIATRHRINNEEPLGAAHVWSVGANTGPDYGVRSTAGQYGLYRRENTDSLGYSRPHVNLDEYTREFAIRSEFRLYGQQDPGTLGQRSSFLGGQDPGFLSRYSHLGSAADPSYSMMNLSAMQRYAPRLDELNHPRVNTSGYETPTAGRNGIPNPHAPQSGYRVDSMGFTPGSYRPF